MKVKSFSMFLGFMAVACPIFSQITLEPEQQPTIRQPSREAYPQVVSDSRIRQRVQNALRSRPGFRRFSSVHYSVDLGYVNLRGTVDTDDDKNDVEAIIREITGVQGVKNDIQVRAKTSKYSAPTVPY